MGGRRVASARGEALAGALGFEQRGLPVAVELHDLGAVHEALAGVGHHVRLAGAPGGERVGPLAGAAQLEHLLAAGDHAAVDEPGGDRRELARGGRQHRLVEQAETGLRAPLADQGEALLVDGERQQVRLTEALGDRCGLLRGRVRLAGVRAQQDGGDEQVAPLHAVAPLAVEQPVAAAEPAGGAAHLAPRQEVDADPERAAHGGRDLAVLQVEVVGASERRPERLVAAEHVVGGGQPLEILGAQRHDAVGALEGRRGVRPRVPGVGLAPAVEVVGDIVHRSRGRCGVVHGSSIRRKPNRGGAVAVRPTAPRPAWNCGLAAARAYGLLRGGAKLAGGRHAREPPLRPGARPRGHLAIALEQAADFLRRLVSATRCCPPSLACAFQRVTSLRRLMSDPTARRAHLRRPPVR